MNTTDSNLKQAVLDELLWEPSVNSAHIGVTAKDGVVTLTGDVTSYAEKWAAQRAASRVVGVKAIAEEIEVRYPSDMKIDDADIAKQALQILSWDIEVPMDKVKVTVQKGVVTLSGSLDWYYQRNTAEGDVRRLHGVTGVVDNIVITPRVQAMDVRDKIQAALKRDARIEADSITVTADGGKVTLSGKVDTWYDDGLAVRTAWSAPGVTKVVDHLTVG
jgi:osmotically-inducible protein OsmY